MPRRERAGRARPCWWRWDGAVRGGFAVADTVKPSAAAAVAGLRGSGCGTVLLTGDNAATAEAVARGRGIDEVVARCCRRTRPGDRAVCRRRDGSVAMVGDGVNDAPALARGGSRAWPSSPAPTRLGAADMILVRDDLGVVPCAIRLARATLRTIRSNLAWAFGYNLLALPLAAFGLLNPIIAAATMAVSSLLVVCNSLRLRRFTGSLAADVR